MSTVIYQTVVFGQLTAKNWETASENWSRNAQIPLDLSRSKPA